MTWSYLCERRSRPARPLIQRSPAQPTRRAFRGGLFSHDAQVAMRNAACCSVASSANGNSRRGGSWTRNPLRVSLRIAALTTACLASALVSAVPSISAPVIEPQIRELARVTPAGSSKGARSYALVEQAEGTNWVDVWLQGSVDRSAVERLGGRVGTTAGNWTTARVPVASLDGLMRLPGLERAQLARGLKFQCDQSVPLTGATELWGGTPPSYPA